MNKKYLNHHFNTNNQNIATPLARDDIIESN